MSLAAVQVAQVRERFTLRSFPAQSSRGSAAAQKVPVLGPPSGVQLAVDAGSLVPRSMTPTPTEARRRANLRLPLRADGAFSLVNEVSNTRIEVALQGAIPSPAQVVDGYAVYPHAMRDAHLIHRPRIDGTEDYLVFDSAPQKSEVRYQMRLSAGVAGLRLVSNVLELLDDSGTPRLRVPPPFVVNTDGDRYPAQIQIEGCQVCVDPAPPWGRKPTPPGAEVCEVIVRWGEARYPALLDPAWTTTADMIQGRSDHTATVLQSGKVLVVGGVATGIGVLGSAEVYDPDSGTWAATASISPSRRTHTANLLLSGRVLIAGGDDGATLVDAPCQVYDPGTGTWTATAKLTQGRSSHTATTLSSGKVLVAGGASGLAKLAHAELYDPSSGTWTVATSMTLPRMWTAASLLPSGHVLVIGGVSGNEAVASAEIYDPASNTWLATGSMARGRRAHTSSVLPSGRVLVAGGNSEPSPPVAELYDPATGTWAATPSMSQARDLHMAGGLPSGRLLVAGGSGTIGAVATAEVYDEMSNTWSSVGDMLFARRMATASALPNGAVLIVGGEYTDGTWHNPAAAELFTLQPDGETCQYAAECATGHCVAGTCCDVACTETWEACRDYQTGLPNGTCGPVITGAPCASNAGCSSKHCVDGVCCDSICNEPCEACTAAKKGGGVDGACGPIANGTDPDAECSAEGSGACMLSRLCDGNGACSSSAGQPCAPASCAGESTLQNARVCDAAGNCVFAGSTDCAPFLCRDGACLDECASVDDCAGQSACIDSQCMVLKNTGAPCSVSAECESGFCVDGACCATACGGLCERCDGTETQGGSPGTCAAVRLGGDPDHDCDPDGTPCHADGHCDGQGACNVLAPSGSFCGMARCESSSVITPICDGAGQCVDDVSKFCGVYACDPGSKDCLTACSSNDDCAEGAVCNPQSAQCASVNYACKDPFTVERSDGSETSCAPYKCENGACRTLCDNDNDCMSTHECVSRQCVVSEPSGGVVIEREEGCGCRQVAPMGAKPRFAVFALLIAVTLLRRKRVLRSLGQ